MNNFFSVLEVEGEDDRTPRNRNAQPKGVAKAQGKAKGKGAQLDIAPNAASLQPNVTKPGSQDRRKNNNGKGRQTAPKTRGRQFDKVSHSGTKQGAKVEKKSGAGKANWGTEKDEAEAQQEYQETVVEEVTEEATEQQQEDEDAKLVTFEEFQRKGGNKKRNVKAAPSRKAGEGVESKEWEKFVVLTDSEEASPYESTKAEKTAKKKQQKKKKEVSVPVNELFQVRSANTSRGGRRNNRNNTRPNNTEGGENKTSSPSNNNNRRGGNNNNNNNNNNNRRNNNNNNRGGNGNRGGRGGSNNNRGNRGPVVNTNDTVAFPSL